MSTTVVEEEPFVATVAGGYLTSVCSNCFVGILERPLKKCVGCNVLRYCGKDCQKEDWSVHKIECKSLVRVSPDVPIQRVRLLARIAIRRSKGEAATVKAFNGRCFDDLVSHSEDVMRTQGVEFEKISVMLQSFLPPELLPEDATILADLGRTNVNSFGINSKGAGGAIGAGIYLGLSVLNHSCAPDSFVIFRGRKAVLRSPQKGLVFSDSLTISYVSLYDLNVVRREKLHSQYFFTCECAVCTDDKRDGYCLSIRCTACTDGVCLVKQGEISLQCVECGAISKTSFGEAMRANKEVDDALEGMKCEEDQNELEAWAASLKHSIEVYSKHAGLLSPLNLPLAQLAYKILFIALSIDKRDVALEYSERFLPAYKRYLPKGEPSMTTHILDAAFSTSLSETPTRRVFELFEEAMAAAVLSHGPNSPETAEIEEVMRKYNSRLRMLKRKN